MGARGRGRRWAASTALGALSLATSLTFGAPGAHGRVLLAESVLPPGQSGFVSTTGVADGTGSPHLNDQTGLFTSFDFKSALFGQAGDAEVPKPGVEIVRDAYGVPRITGASDYDAWWGVGYAVAQDRLFQLELFRRATSGRLAEILGRSFLDDDLIARRDYYTEPELQAMMATLPRNLVARAEAYRDGINAWVEQVRADPTKRPGEFTALGVDLPTWTVLDTARIGVFLARTVPSGDGLELENAHALRELGARSFNELLPLRVPGQVPTVPRRNGTFPSQPGRTRAEERAAFLGSRRFLKGLELPPPGEEAGGQAATGGSYMWGIGRPARRVRGRGGRVRFVRPRGPAPSYHFNGPQLGFSIPELFVEFELHSPTQDMRGVSAAGVPVLGAGHNGRIAWGLTSGLSDEDDLYVESLTGAESYRFKGAERQMSCRDEVFTFRAPPTELPGVVDDPSSASGQRTERICRTVHGPVQQRGEGVAFARRYAIWGRELETLVGLSALNDADSVYAADRALLDVTWNENVIATDDQGNIGYWHPGLHPLRPRGYDERLPYPGTGEAEWTGLLQRRRTPHVINPREGYLVQWNNVPSVGWTSGDAPARERLAGRLHRAELLRRLVARVARRPTYERSRAIDRVSGTTAQQRPLVESELRRARRGSRAEARRVLEVLIEWDGDYNRTDANGTVHPGVAIFEELKDQAERIALFGLEDRPVGPGTRSVAGEPGTSHEFDISNGEAFALRTLSAAQLRTAAQRTHEELASRFRDLNPDTWREPRRMYEVMAQGAAATPELPFFDRGTWQQSIALGP